MNFIIKKDVKFLSFSRLLSMMISFSGVRCSSCEILCFFILSNTERTVRRTTVLVIAWTLGVPRRVNLPCSYSYMCADQQASTMVIDIYNSVRSKPIFQLCSVSQEFNVNHVKYIFFIVNNTERTVRRRTVLVIAWTSGV